MHKDLLLKKYNYVEIVKTKNDDLLFNILFLLQN